MDCPIIRRYYDIRGFAYNGATRSKSELCLCCDTCSVVTFRQKDDSDHSNSSLVRTELYVLNVGYVFFFLLFIRSIIALFAPCCSGLSRVQACEIQEIASFSLS
jgi:hypothetical protein